MALQYSKLSQDWETSYTDSHPEINWYPGVDVSNHAWNKRQVLKHQMDEFCTFMFGGCDAWENFGAFIITDKRGDNKFYNGPSYTNKYSSPQFSNASGNLLGIDFKQQTISFKIGLYYFTIEDYQLFLDFLGAYKVDYLSFGFADKWSYLVKPAAIGDSPRYVMETYEDDSNVKHYWYYTELTLKFEIQGPACAQYIEEYHWKRLSIFSSSASYQFNKDSSDNSLPLSLLDFPFTIDLPLYLNSTEPTIKAEIIYNSMSYTLFDIKFENLSFTNIGLVKLRFYNSQLQEYDEDSSEWIDASNTWSYQPAISSIQTQYYLWQPDIVNAKQPIILEWISSGNSKEFYVYDPEQASYNGIGENKNVLPYINNSTLNLHYDSESGLLFLMLGDSTLKLLSLTTSTVRGENLIQYLYAIKFHIPGSLKHQNINNLMIQFSFSGITVETGNSSLDWLDPITCRARTNII